MSEKNYYIILEINKNASAQEIKAAYRQLAKKYHPDKNIGNKAAEEYFKEIQEAYFILSNPEKRRKYDLKFFYKNNYSSQTKKATSTPYRGNAYQYAQQQAQHKQQNNKKKEEDIQEDTSEVNQIFMSIGIALILLYFIISYSS